ncbi:MAG: molecular chaperone TorD family protein [Nitrospira sp.]|nr:molecular chaperone TorD family protein [Nitrospira sp.]
MDINEIDLTLCRSALYEALALGFRSPSAETLKRLVTEEQNADLAEIAWILDSRSKDKKSERLLSHVRQLKCCADAQNLETLKTSYGFLFGHTAQPKIPPYETEYGEETLFRQPQELGDIAGFYNAFGLTWNPHEYERVDHISGECEFLSFLTRKEAYALEQQDLPTLEETRKAQRLFLKDHLGLFAPSFAKLLTQEDLDGFYSTLGNICYEFIQQECDQFGIPAGLEQLRFRSTMTMDDCFTCGSGEELIRAISCAGAMRK